LIAFIVNIFLVRMNDSLSQCTNCGSLAP